MIDLHSHILPNIDDGSRSLEMSLDMARIAVADGIEVMACTPHIYPGLYMNDTAGIIAARDALQRELDLQGIPLKLTIGADVHMDPALVQNLAAGVVPTLHQSRYLLLEPPHHVAPPRFLESVFDLVLAGYVPVITHPERLTWIETHYASFVELTRRGAWMQVTAASLTGLFGPRARYWGEKLLGEGHTHLLASDCHSNRRRVPVLSEGLAVAERLVGKDEAQQLVVGRPQAILGNVPLSQTAQLPAPAAAPSQGWRGWLRRWRA